MVTHTHTHTLFFNQSSHFFLPSTKSLLLFHVRHGLSYVYTFCVCMHDPLFNKDCLHEPEWGIVYIKKGNVYKWL